MTRGARRGMYVVLKGRGCPRIGCSKVGICFSRVAEVHKEEQILNMTTIWSLESFTPNTYGDRHDNAAREPLTLPLKTAAIVELVLPREDHNKRLSYKKVVL